MFPCSHFGLALSLSALSPLGNTKFLRNASVDSRKYSGTDSMKIHKTVASGTLDIVFMFYGVLSGLDRPEFSLYDGLAATQIWRMQLFSRTENRGLGCNFGTAGETMTELRASLGPLPSSSLTRLLLAGFQQGDRAPVPE